MTQAGDDGDLSRVVYWGPDHLAAHEAIEGFDIQSVETRICTSCDTADLGISELRPDDILVVGADEYTAGTGNVMEKVGRVASPVVILVTTPDSPQVHAKALEAGPVDYLVPEDDPGQLKEYLRDRLVDNEPTPREVGNMTQVEEPNPSPTTGGLGTALQTASSTSPPLRGRAISSDHHPLRQLQKASNRLSRAVTQEEIAEMAVESAVDILGHEHIGLYCEAADGEGRKLVPLAESEAVEERFEDEVKFRPGESLAWEVFESGEGRLFHDVSRLSETHSQNTEMGSEVIVPVGDRGVFISGSTSPGEFAEVDKILLSVLASSVAAELGRVEREQSLRETKRYTEELIDSIPGMVYVLDTDGSILDYNDNLSDRVALDDCRDLIGTNFTGIVHSDSAEAVADAIRGAIEEGEARMIEGRIETDSGHEEYGLSFAPLTDPDGNITGVCGLAKSVEQLKEQQRLLSWQGEQLELLNSLLRHEVINSITIIMGKSEHVAHLLNDADDVDEEVVEIAEAIVDRCESLADLSKDTKDLINSVSSEGEMEVRSINLADIIDRVATELRGMNQDAIIEVEKPEDLEVCANRFLRNVLSNLVTNAIKYNDKKDPRVAIEATRESDNEMAVLRVSDNGPGIPPSEIENVFERGSRATSTARTGEGFGLFFAKQMVDRYGGTIEVENDDVGCTFTVTIPLAC